VVLEEISVSELVKEVKEREVVAGIERDQTDTEADREKGRTGKIDTGKG
jgi:hypothetical protein